jgi:hypothetical protein
VVWVKEKEGERVAGREKSEVDFLFSFEGKGQPFGFCVIFLDLLILLFFLNRDLFSLTLLFIFNS